MPIIPHIEELRPASLEDRIATSRRIKAMFAPPSVLVPYEEWSAEIEEFRRDRGRGFMLADPPDLGPRLRRRGDVQVFALNPREITIDHLLRYQEIFYRDAYKDPTFTIDRSRLDLPRERLDDIKAALLHGEVNYPLVVATPPNGFSPSSGGGARGGGDAPTLHRLLFDHLIRGRNIKVWQRTDPTVDEFLEQLRDLSLPDLTRADLLGPDGKLLAFTNDAWLPYLQALYPTLPRPTAQPEYIDLSFVAWEQDPPAGRVIPNATGPNGGAVMIQGRSQLDAVAFRYPLITPSRHLALFAQYHAATGQHLDTSTWSWLFGMIDPQRFPGGPAVHVGWDAGELYLGRRDPRDADSGGRLRGAR